MKRTRWIWLVLMKDGQAYYATADTLLAFETREAAQRWANANCQSRPRIVKCPVPDDGRGTT